MDSDDDIFITQNTFSRNHDFSLIDTQNVEAMADNLLNISYSDLYFGDNDPKPTNVTPKHSSPYRPVFSDISEDELVASCVAVEKNSRFGETPMTDEQVSAKSGKRQVFVSHSSHMELWEGGGGGIF